MKKIILPGLLVGVANFIASMLVSQIFRVIFPSVNAEYTNPNLFRAYSDPLMLLFFVYPFLLGIILAWFWNKTKTLFVSPEAGSRPGGSTRAAIKFALTYFVVSTIPGMFVTYSSMPYSFLIVLSWLVEGLLNGLIAGIILAKLNK
jgi:hypothetical protein